MWLDWHEDDYFAAATVSATKTTTRLPSPLAIEILESGHRGPKVGEQRRNRGRERE